MPHSLRGLKVGACCATVAALLTLSCLAVAAAESAADCRCPPPAGFIHVAEAIPDVLLDIRYYSTYNFLDERVDGYEAPVAMLSLEAAAALGRASEACLARGLALKVFDAYRPHRAVEHFIRWALDAGDVRNKNIFYPAVDKINLFRLGYISERSGHSRGSTVDLTLVDRRSGREVDMGAPFDFFGEISHHGSALVTPAQAANRLLLKAIMADAGFKPYPYEWWHYTLENEPYPNTYFDFPVR